MVFPFGFLCLWRSNVGDFQSGESLVDYMPSYERAQWMTSYVQFSGLSVSRNSDVLVKPDGSSQVISGTNLLSIIFLPFHPFSTHVTNLTFSSD